MSYLIVERLLHRVERVKRVDGIVQMRQGIAVCTVAAIAAKVAAQWILNRIAKRIELLLSSLVAVAVI
jgi:phosphoribosylcarboxyaminoimidazole (NCAIR) mutase